MKNTDIALTANQFRVFKPGRTLCGVEAAQHVVPETADPTCWNCLRSAVPAAEFPRPLPRRTSGPYCPRCGENRSHWTGCPNAELPQ